MIHAHYNRCKHIIIIIIIYVRRYKISPTGTSGMHVYKVHTTVIVFRNYRINNRRTNFIARRTTTMWNWLPFGYRSGCGLWHGDVATDKCAKAITYITPNGKTTDHYLTKKKSQPVLNAFLTPVVWSMSDHYRSDKNIRHIVGLILLYILASG